ncbi:hypothetical protein ACVIKO_000272 [Rhizobium ruizarguesonis]
MRTAHGHLPSRANADFSVISLSGETYYPSPPPNSLGSGISAADGRQSAFQIGCDRMLLRRGFSSLVELHFGHKTRLQLVIFSRMFYLYKLP